MSEQQLMQSNHMEGVWRLQRVCAFLEAAVVMQIRADEQQQQQEGGQQHGAQQGMHAPAVDAQHAQASSSSSGSGGALVAARAPAPPRLPGPAGGAYPPASGALVSVQQLPRVDAWDDAWEACVRSLQTLDLLLLHKQWLQWCAIKLPTIQVLEGRPQGDAARLQLEDLYDRYTAFTQHVIRLAPEPWRESVHYNLDSLTPMDRPWDSLAKHYQDFWRLQFPDELEAMFSARNGFLARIAALREEQARLQQRCDERAAAGAFPAPPPPPPLGGEEASPEPGGEGQEEGGRSEELNDDWELLLQVNENLRQQELQLSGCTRAVFTAISAVQMMQSKVTLYPIAANGHFLWFPDQRSAAQQQA